MQFLKILWGNGIGLSHQFDGGNRAGGSTDPATDAPFFIGNGKIALHLNHLDRADVHTEPAPGTPLSIRLPEKIGGHEDIPWDLFSSDRPHGPAATATAVTGMFDAISGIIYKVDESGFFRFFNYFQGLCF